MSTNCPCDRESHINTQVFKHTPTRTRTHEPHMHTHTLVGTFLLPQLLLRSLLSYTSFVVLSPFSFFPLPSTKDQRCQAQIYMLFA